MHQRQQRGLLMNPLSNQPNSCLCARLGHFPIKSRLNIGCRVGLQGLSWVGGCCLSLPFCFSLVIRTRHQPNRWPP